MLTEEQKEIIITMKKENHTWGSIATAIKKTKASVRNWYARNKMLIGLEPKPIIRNLRTSGIVGTTIKKNVQEKPIDFNVRSHYQT